MRCLPLLAVRRPTEARLVMVVWLRTCDQRDDRPAVKPGTESRDGINRGRKFVCSPVTPTRANNATRQRNADRPWMMPWNTRSVEFTSCGSLHPPGYRRCQSRKKNHNPVPWPSPVPASWRQPATVARRSATTDCHFAMSLTLAARIFHPKLPSSSLSTSASVRCPSPTWRHPIAKRASLHVSPGTLDLTRPEPAPFGCRAAVIVVGSAVCSPRRGYRCRGSQPHEAFLQPLGWSGELFREPR